MESEAIPHPVENRSYNALGLRVLALDAGHIGGPAFGTQAIHRSRLQAGLIISAAMRAM